MAHESILRKNDAVLVVVDIQEKLLPVIANNEQVEKNSGILVEAAGILDIPVIVSEQYPKGLGNTVPRLAEKFAKHQLVEKLTFSCCGEDSFLDKIEEIGRDQIIICGIETHICVLQSALDLLDQGSQVHVAADAVGSRNPENRVIALERMAQAGTVVSCTESILFEMLEAAGSDEFKAISKLVR